VILHNNPKTAYGASFIAHETTVREKACKDFAKSFKGFASSSFILIKATPIKIDKITKAKILPSSLSFTLFTGIKSTIISGIEISFKTDVSFKTTCVDEI